MIISLFFFFNSRARKIKSKGVYGPRKFGVPTLSKAFSQHARPASIPRVSILSDHVYLGPLRCPTLICTEHFILSLNWRHDHMRANNRTGLYFLSVPYYKNPYE